MLFYYYYVLEAVYISCICMVKIIPVLCCCTYLSTLCLVTLVVTCNCRGCKSPWKYSKCYTSGLAFSAPPPSSFFLLAFFLFQRTGCKIFTSTSTAYMLPPPFCCTMTWGGRMTLSGLNPHKPLCTASPACHSWQVMLLPMLGVMPSFSLSS